MKKVCQDKCHLCENYVKGGLLECNATRRTTMIDEFRMVDKEELQRRKTLYEEQGLMDTEDYHDIVDVLESYIEVKDLNLFSLLAEVI